MRKYKGSKSIETIREQAESMGLWVKTDKYDQGDDNITIGWVSEQTKFGCIIFNTFNGHFLVYDDKGKLVATYESTEYDNEDWYVKILEFLYEPIKE